MKILYLSCHSILEYDEIKLFTEMGHQVFSVNGSYANPQSPIDNKRPSFQGFYSDQLNAVALQCSKENLHQELIDWADVIYVMHRDDWIINNWEKFKGKPVIWRTIGQSIPAMEAKLVLCRMQGLKIVRYSPEEQNLGGYIGHDAIIRFYKDPEEFKGYNGETNKVMTVSQSMIEREPYCGWGIFNKATEGLDRVVFGPKNEETGCWGGLLSYEDLKKAYRDHRVYFYTGTYPASYTLNLIEAMMTGMPIVAIDREMANLNIYPQTDVYEVDKLIQVVENLEEARSFIEFFLSDNAYALQEGKKNRLTAEEIFGKESIKKQWEAFFNEL